MDAAPAPKTNKHPGRCTACRVMVPAGAGTLWRLLGVWNVRCADQAACFDRDMARVKAEQDHRRRRRFAA